MNRYKEGKVGEKKRKKGEDGKKENKVEEDKSKKGNDQRQQKYDEEMREKVNHMQVEKPLKSKVGVMVNAMFPQFCLLLAPDDFSGKLRIPLAFNAILENESLGIISLNGPSGNIWRAKLVQDSDRICFVNGWKQFSIDHQLESGDFLVFSYHGHSQFSVLVFDKTECAKKSAFSACPGNTLDVESENAALGIDANDFYNNGSYEIDPLQDDELALCIDGRKTAKVTENDRSNAAHASQHDVQENGFLQKFSGSSWKARDRLPGDSFCATREAAIMETDSGDTSEYYERVNEENNATGHLQGNGSTMDHTKNTASYSKQGKCIIDEAEPTSALPRLNERKKFLSDLPESPQKTRGRRSKDQFGNSMELRSNRLSSMKAMKKSGTHRGSLQANGSTMDHAKNTTSYSKQGKCIIDRAGPTSALPRLNERTKFLSELLESPQKTRSRRSKDQFSTSKELRSNRLSSMKAMKKSEMHCGSLQGNGSNMDRAKNTACYSKQEKCSIDDADPTSALPRLNERKKFLSELPESPQKTRGRRPKDQFGPSNELRSNRLSSMKAVAKVQNLFISQRGVIVEKDEVNTLKRKRESRLHPNYPFTLQIMKDCTDLPSFFMDIPNEFVRDCLPNVNAKITLWNREGKPWEINYVYNKSLCAFCCGWGAFVKDNNIEKDDICLFELIQENNIKVGVFRVAQVATPRIPMLK